MEQDLEWNNLTPSEKATSRRITFWPEELHQDFTCVRTATEVSETDKQFGSLPRPKLRDLVLNTQDR